MRIIKGFKTAKYFKNTLKFWFAFGVFGTFSHAATLQESKWEQGQTLLTFFEKNAVPLKTYYELAPEDKELADEIISGSTYYTLYDDSTLLQALIPINENSQLHVFKQGDKYGMRAIPIVYFSKEHTISLSVSNSLYNDITRLTGDSFLASDFIQAYKGSVDFRKEVRKGDQLAIIYERKYRLGKNFGAPNIKASTLRVSNNNRYVIRHEDGHFYDLKGNNLTKYLLTVPLQYKRISSHFSMGRKHPILGYKRPHLGTDYAAPRHTPIRAAGNGRVLFAGTKGGYGKTVIIQHDNGYRTLYAHMHKIERKIRTGTQVKQGRKIGTVGSTGLSTGPHLHFGLYKNGNAVNPIKHLKVAQSKLQGKEKESFLISAKNYKEALNTALREDRLQNIPFKRVKNDYIVYLSKDDKNLN
ncbi:peptidoglycan DD-metalloendopeptidase family protein [Helicobacter turcicus]|uniref:Peptidoglycan DD-metalloendopeptidase family protein n=1 Tax=Helicobacter turcicus TaxID=2867412 RepID=A0ABS7JNC4_9HELI|nr:peptidoglycan DD-metalloendopeptidase family protein [Helicobacter turcicus]MBX7490897.1 peptidoglycan DD-metalloendopeptidase family protein [Helicobacter turcicus]MBX7545751.1 peptidoglycan DD-metalloendopeptidase family protein [Helicobacter turcicus]